MRFQSALLTSASDQRPQCSRQKLLSSATQSLRTRQLHDQYGSPTVLLQGSANQKDKQNQCGTYMYQPKVKRSFEIQTGGVQLRQARRRSSARTDIGICLASARSRRRLGARQPKAHFNGRAKRLRLLAPQAVSPAPAADSSDRNGALASAPPLDSRTTTVRCAVPNSRPWFASRPRESFQPNPQTRSCAPKPTSDGQSADRQLSNVDR